MKITDSGFLPQVELGPTIGGVKQLYMRAGSMIFQPVTMVGAMLAAWGTNPGVRSIFHDSLLAYFGSVALLGVTWMAIYYVVILPSEESFIQGQAHRSERSPLKQDTEALLERLDRLERRSRQRADGGETDGHE